MKALFSSALILLLLLTAVSCNKDDKEETPEAPVAAFSVTNGECEAPCTVTFTNTSKNATSYSWNFGDGSAASTATSPTHEYTTAGTYTVTLTATGEGGSKSYSTSVKINASQFYITFKANNIPISLSNVYGMRNTTSDPRTLSIHGTGSDGARPAFTFLTSETFIGFSAGLTVGCHSNTTPYDYVEYTNSSGTLFSTADDDDGIYMFISSVSYTNGGIVEGTFNSTGSVTSAGGQKVSISEGKFRVKLNN